MREIDHRSETPVYRQIAAALREEIDAGRLAPRQPLPSELHLQQRFGVARDTVRRALAALAELGLVRTVSGRGTYVRAREVEMVAIEPGMRIFTRPATEAERVTLDLAEGVWVLVIEYADGRVEVLPGDAAELRTEGE